MTAANWPASYKVVRVYEGGDIDDPKDPGGRTSRGVTQRTYNAYRDQMGLVRRDVYKAGEDEIAAIYRKQFADAVRFDKLRVGVDVVMLDSAIHSGPKQALKWLQSALKSFGLYAGEIDGVWGLQTAQALETRDMDDDMLVAQILKARFASLKRFKGWKDYQKGWTARISNLLKIGQAWANGSVGPAPVAVAGGSAKAEPPSTSVPAAKAQTGTSTAGGGLVVGGAAEVIRQAKDQLAPYAGTSIVDKVLIGLTIAGAGVLVVSLAYSWWKGRKAKNAVTATGGEEFAEIPEDADVQPA